MKENVTVKEIEQLDFSSLVGVVREPNMCSGGIETLRVIIRESNIRHDAKILEVGSNTGFSSIEFASTLPHAHVVGIDMNPISVAFSKDKAKKFGIDNVEFIQANALKLPFEDDSFDMVFISNVTSFINDRETAITEYIRVLKPGGILAVAPIYYRETPPEHIVTAVEEAILANVTVRDKSYWKEILSGFEIQEYFDQDYKYIKSTEEEMSSYVDMVMSQEHLRSYDEDLVVAMKKRLQYFYELFDENLQYAGFSVMLYRYQSPNDIPILHKTCLVKG
ncbi:ubiquinone/menaquinone biosynthesis C-methylase UbiE [Croceifilum oryzae]|uniref:Ubiquinone/menaquinone biosynthesis C-methylase UbiE n=1 Tax=Croceifilum oryzae TaxID=1553429 RepID=A0AAJ1TND5_9BACL|nr:class I SAM-dependent methyltransferase [Croceifilum oryzae]MDQ0417960.1 ubiquinone/menaquinone biosynthesis C-methylase UbiE [Croceifilum oryzae]